MNKSITSTLVCALAISAFTSCHKTTFDEKVSQEVLDFNLNQAPQKMDRCTMLDSMNYDVETKAICYYYTVSGECDNAEMITADVKKSLRESIVASVKGSIQLKPYKEHGLTFRYIYISQKTGKVMNEIAISKSEY